MSIQTTPTGLFGPGASVAAECPARGVRQTAEDVFGARLGCSLRTVKRVERAPQVDPGLPIDLAGGEPDAIEHDLDGQRFADNGHAGACFLLASGRGFLSSCCHRRQRCRDDHDGKISSGHSSLGFNDGASLFTQHPR